MKETHDAASKSVDRLSNKKANATQQLKWLLSVPIICVYVHICAYKTSEDRSVVSIREK